MFATDLMPIISAKRVGCAVGCGHFVCRNATVLDVLIKVCKLPSVRNFRPNHTDLDTSSVLGEAELSEKATFVHRHLNSVIANRRLFLSLRCNLPLARRRLCRSLGFSICVRKLIG